MKQKLLPRLPPSRQFELTGAKTEHGEDGVRHATDGTVTAQMPADANTKIFKRNGIRIKPTAELMAGQMFGHDEERVQWLVMELDGVRCYVHSVDGEVTILMSREDLYP